MDDARRCGARAKRTGERCKKRALKGATVCGTHGAGARQVKEAAQRRHHEAQAIKLASQMVERAGVDQDPIEHLLDSLHLAAALVDVWGAMVAAIDEAAEDEAAARGEIRGGLGYIEDNSQSSPYELNVVSRDRMLALDRHGQAGIHPYVIQYERALERRAKFAKLCIDAGIAERQVRIAERQAEMLGQMIRDLFDELDIELTPAVTKTVGRHLRLLSGAAESSS